MINNIQKTLIFIGAAVFFALGSHAGDAFADASYTYYSDGRIKTVTYTPAEGGVSSLEYLDEDWLGRGYGRVRKRMIANVAPDGATAYEYTYPKDTVLLSAKLGGASGDDVIAAAGSDGLWEYMDNSSWAKISSSIPDVMEKARLNANSVDDIVVDFGSIGLWKFADNASWTRLSASDAEDIATGDLDNSGIDDVLVDFGATGLWKYSNDASWSFISASNAKDIAVGDLDNNGQADAVVDFGTLGLYKYMNGSAWYKVSDSTTERVVIADLDNNGTKDMVVDFGSLGLYKYMNNSSWEKVSNSNPENILVDDFDNNGTNDMFVDFGASGLWEYMNNSSWTKVSDADPEKMLAADLDGNGVKDVVADFGATGIYKYMNRSSWAKISSSDATDMTAADLDGNGISDLVVDFRASGLYKYMNGSSWAFLSSLNGNRTSSTAGYLSGDYSTLFYNSTYNSSGELIYTEYDHYDGSDVLSGTQRCYGSSQAEGITDEFAYVTIGGESVWKQIARVDRNNGWVTRFAYDREDGEHTTHVVYFNTSTWTYSTIDISGNVVVRDTMDGSQVTDRWVYNFDPSGNILNPAGWTNPHHIDMTKFVGFSQTGTIDPNTFVWYSSNLPVPNAADSYYGSGRLRTHYDADTGRLIEYADEAFYDIGYPGEHGRKIWELNADGTRVTYEYFGSTDDIDHLKKYNAEGTLIEERTAVARDVPDPRADEFLTVANLAWSDYGYDLGIAIQPPERAGQHYGYSAYPDRLREKLSKWEGNCVRVFLFCDIRAGIEFSDGVSAKYYDSEIDAIMPAGTPYAFNGGPTGDYTNAVFADMAELLAAATELNIKLIPTLFDYRIADGENDAYHGEHKDLIENEYKRGKLLDLMSTLIAEFGASPAVYAWDVMNEPEMACEGRENEVPMEGALGMKEFVKELIKMVHTSAPGAKATVGSFEKGEMMKNWVPLDADPLRNADVLQYHYYDNMKQYHLYDYQRLDHPRASLDDILSLDGRPVIAGELDPTYVEYKLDTLAQNGIDGGLFWDDSGSLGLPGNPQWNVSAAELAAIEDWFFGIARTYYEDTGLLESIRQPSLDGTGWVYRRYSNADIGGRGYGLLLNEVTAVTDEYGSRAYSYEYWTGTETLKTAYAYHVGEYPDVSSPDLSDLVFTAHYDGSGIETSREWATTYYADTWFKSSDTFAEPDGYGNVYKNYLNERDDWSAGHGREYIEVRETADADGVIAYMYGYYADTYTRIWEYQFEGGDYSDVLNPALDKMLYVVERNSSGVFQAKHKALTWYDSAGHPVKKLERFTDEAMTEPNWSETRWYRENGNLSDGLKSSGEATSYFDVEGEVERTIFYSNGYIDSWAAPEDSLNYNKKDWWFNAAGDGGKGIVEKYSYFESDWVKFKDVYMDSDQDGIWSWQSGEVFQEGSGAGFPWGPSTPTSNRADTGASEFFDKPVKPTRDMAEPLGAEMQQASLPLMNELSSKQSALEGQSNEFTGTSPEGGFTDPMEQ